MEEQYKKVTAIITRLAKANPYITKEQVTKAKSMYNGDNRPIEEIEKELEAYSKEIAERGKQKENSIERPQDNNRAENKHQLTDVEQTHVMSLVQPSLEKEPVEIYEPLRVELPGDDNKEELQKMINDSLGDTSESTATNTNETTNVADKDQVKVLVKTSVQAPNDNAGYSSTNNDSGYGNITALLTLTIIFSIITMITALFTIITN